MRPLVEITFIAFDPSHIVQHAGPTKATPAVVHKDAVIEIFLRGRGVHVICTVLGKIFGKVPRDEVEQVRVFEGLGF